MKNIKKTDKLLILLFIISLMLFSGCGSNDSSPSKAPDYEGFNAVFRAYYDEMMVPQRNLNMILFAGYRIGNRNLKITVTNTWFNTASHNRKGLLQTIGQTYNTLRIAHGLTEGDTIMVNSLDYEVCRYTLWGDIKGSCD